MGEPAEKDKVSKSRMGPDGIRNQTIEVKEVRHYN